MLARKKEKVIATKAGRKKEGRESEAPNETAKKLEVEGKVP